MKKMTPPPLCSLPSGTLVLFALLSLLLASCNPEKPTIAKVKVVDTSGIPVPSAMVRLYPTPTIPNFKPTIIDDTLYSDANGYATFDYTDRFNRGQSGFAVLDIQVEGAGGLAGEGIIKIVEEETVEETVIVE